MSEGKQTKAAEWDVKLAAVRTFAETNKRWPSTTSKEEEEKSLAQWFSRVKYYAQQEKPDEKAQGIAPDKAVRVRELVAQFPSLERDGRWDTKFRQVELRILAARSLWSQKGATDEQMKLIRWWNQQKTFLKKFRSGTPITGMTDDRASRIEKLMGFTSTSNTSTPA